MITSILWLPASLLAGFFQAWRTAVQQRLRAELSVSGAGLVRYLYGAPVSLIILFVYATLHWFLLPTLSSTFFVYAALGGLAQIIGTLLLIAAFGYRNFVVGTAFSKNEAVQAALFAWIVLGEKLTTLAVVGIVFGVVGVLVLSLGGRKLSAKETLIALKERAAMCGLSAGALFALTAVFVKRATLSLEMTDPIAAALITLTFVIILQTLMHGSYVAWREPATLNRVFVTWKTSSQVGVLASLGSACWFIGFATAPVALVRIVGQVEVVFTLVFSTIYLREATKRHEVMGLVLVAVGVVLALCGGIA